VNVTVSRVPAAFTVGVPAVTPKPVMFTVSAPVKWVPVMVTGTVLEPVAGCVVEAGTIGFIAGRLRAGGPPFCPVSTAPTSTHG
jgi:hypothetical protein